MSVTDPPATMRAWMASRHGEPAEALSLAQIEVPAPGYGQVLVRVEAAAVNYSDGLMVRGTYQSSPEPPFIAGMEAAGRVAGVGEGVSIEPGTRVAGLTSGLVGAFAEYALMDVGSFVTPPPSFSPAQASGFSAAYQTAWFAVHLRGQVRPGDRVLVCGAAGGVGTAAAQLASAAGAEVFGVVDSESKAAVARASGCVAAVLSDGSNDLVDDLKSAMGGRADVVIDMVGGPVYAAAERIVGFEGRIVVVGFASGAVPKPRADLVMVKNFSVVGLHWGLYRSQAPELVAAQYDLLVDAITNAALVPYVSREFSFDEAVDALEQVGHGRSLGRVAISIDIVE